MHLESWKCPGRMEKVHGNVPSSYCQFCTQAIQKLRGKYYNVALRCYFKISKAPTSAEIASRFP